MLASKLSQVANGYVKLPGITLRPVGVEQAQQLYYLVCDNKTELKWFPNEWARTDWEHFKYYIDEVEEDNIIGVNFTYSLWEKESICGVVGFKEYNLQNKSTSLWYWLDENYTGKGICTSACQALIQAGFEVLNLHRIDLWCAVNNTRSNLVARRLGFIEEGILRKAEWVDNHYEDLRFYGLLENDFKEKQWSQQHQLKLL